MKKITLLTLALLGAAIAPVAATAADTKATAKAERYDLAKIFAKGLVDADGKPVKPEKIAKAEYVAVYFSAHWCPPCRAFTPKLVKFADDHAKSGKVAFVFLSSDRSQKDMLGYMTEAKMPWPGILSKDAKLAGPISQGISGIPHLRVFNKKGEVVIDSVKDGQYVGPNYVLNELGAKLK